MVNRLSGWSGHLQVKTFTEHPAVGGQGAVGGQHVEQLAAGQELW